MKVKTEPEYKLRRALVAFSMLMIGVLMIFLSHGIWNKQTQESLETARVDWVPGFFGLVVWLVGAVFCGAGIYLAFVTVRAKQTPPKKLVKMPDEARVYSMPRSHSHGGRG